MQAATSVLALTPMMHIETQPGTYVVAVSGGVDSIVLLHLLHQHKQAGASLQLIVAHFDHGIRSDSIEDRQLVQDLAHEMNLPFEYGEGRLGEHASEATARDARYAFLRQVRENYTADALMTAHHQDDVLETALLNILRGTGRRGLTSLRSTPEIVRPLLGYPKAELLRYAEQEGYLWHEDSTNTDPTYLRNYVRMHILPRYGESGRAAFLEILTRLEAVNDELDAEVRQYIESNLHSEGLDRRAFTLLDHAESREVLAGWLRESTMVELSSAMLERLVVAIKTGRSGQRVDVAAGYSLEISPRYLALILAER